jgi:hypothetical protein
VVEAGQCGLETAARLADQAVAGMRQFSKYSSVVGDP